MDRYSNSPPRASDALEPEIEYLAQRRARAKMGWYIHATIYVLVNLGLAFVSARSGRNWAVFPALGWGLGLMIHGAAVWLGARGGNLYAKLLERERDALRGKR